MATTKKDFQEWLNTLDDDAVLAIDDGGLTIVAFDADYNPETDPFDGFSGPYFELGGIPLKQYLCSACGQECDFEPELHSGEPGPVCKNAECRLSNVEQGGAR